MRTKHVFYFSFLIACLFVHTTSGQTDRDILEEVVEKYIESQGGRVRLATILSLEVEGVIEMTSQGIKIPVVQKIQYPDKVLLTQEYESFGTVREVLNGDSGWEWHPIAGERPLDEAEIKDLLKDADLHRDLRLFELYAGIRLGSPETIEGIETVHLIFLDKEGKEEHWYFKENGDLFQKIHTVTSGPDSEFESKERYYDFKTVRGFRFPHRIKYLHPAYTAVLNVTLCLINEKFDPSTFELPPAATVEPGLRRF